MKKNAWEKSHVLVRRMSSLVFIKEQFAIIHNGDDELISHGQTFAVQETLEGKIIFYQAMEKGNKR